MREAMFWGLGCVAGIVLLCTPGCRGVEKVSQQGEDVSVADFKSVASNLKPFEIESCDVERIQANVGRGVPSPSDRMIEYRGSIKLTEKGAAEVKEHFEWHHVSADEIPTAVKSLLGTKKYVTSKKLNKSFEKNGTFQNGYVIAEADSDMRTIYLVVRDIDHAID